MNPRLRLVCAAALFSTAGAAIKWCQFGAWQIAAFRGLVAGVTILLLIPAARRGWSWRAAAVGLAYAGAGVFFVLANKLTTAANTVFLQATNPLYILLLAPWILHERPSRSDLLYMAAVASGLVLLFSGAPRHFATAPDPRLGNILAEGSAVCWALTVIGYRWIARGARDARGAVASAAATGNFMVFALALPFALPLAAGRAADWATVAYLGVFQLRVAYVFLSRAVAQHVPRLPRRVARISAPRRAVPAFHVLKPLLGVLAIVAPVAARVARVVAQVAPVPPDLVAVFGGVRRLLRGGVRRQTQYECHGGGQPSAISHTKGLVPGRC